MKPSATSITAVAIALLSALPSLPLAHAEPARSIAEWRPGCAVALESFSGFMREAKFMEWMDAHVDQCGRADEAIAKAKKFLRGAEKLRKEKRLAAEERPLTVLEVVAIQCYTARAYRDLNKALWSQSKQRVDEVAGFREVLESAIDKMPLFRGEVARALTIPEEWMIDYEVGATLTFHGFTSCSEGGPIAGGPHLFLIQSRTGRNIAAYSTNWYEREVLFAPGRKFKITERKETPYSQLIFKLEEVEN